MFELWKVLKRNPTTYNPRLAGLIFLGYVGVGVYSQTIDKLFSEMVKKTSNLVNKKKIKEKLQ